jgi:hypothetical protein
VGTEEKKTPSIIFERVAVYYQCVYLQRGEIDCNHFAPSFFAVQNLELFFFLRRQIYLQGSEGGEFLLNLVQVEGLTEVKNSDCCLLGLKPCSLRVGTGVRVETDASVLTVDILKLQFPTNVGNRSQEYTVSLPREPHPVWIW